jgi:release factor glutamine methyltransferase
MRTPQGLIIAAPTVTPPTEHQSLSSAASILRAAAQQLTAVSSSPQLDAQWLLEHVTHWTRTGMISDPQLEVTADQLARFQSLVERRARGEPLAYLIGSRDFWSLTLQVSPDVLIPRPETELLVEQSLLKLEKITAPRVLDLGTGSGAVALSLARERPDARILATDTSQAALVVAQINAANNSIRNVVFAHGSWYEPVAGTAFDLIVSNPPYIAQDDPALDKHVLQYEPFGALISGTGGLEAIAAIIAGGVAHLRVGGWLLLEHGWKQAADVARLLELHGFTHVRCHPDLAGLDRVSAGQRS